jgi:hypothetical protein
VKVWWRCDGGGTLVASGTKLLTRDCMFSYLGKQTYIATVAVLCALLQVT